MLEKNAFVPISINGNLVYWPYPEAQDFTSYDLSNYVVYLSFEEVNYVNKRS